jgi:hypothetical protein
MRPAIAYSVILTLLACQPAAADQDLADKLVGSWRVVSLKLSYLNENTEQEVRCWEPIRLDALFTVQIVTLQRSYHVETANRRRPMRMPPPF